MTPHLQSHTDTATASHEREHDTPSKQRWARDWLLSGESSGAPGHRLLPLWPELVQALPRFGETCVVSRNQHVVLGGRCTYPEYGKKDIRRNSPWFHHDFSAWSEGWFYRETLHDNLVSAGIEIRDTEGLGFHKVLLSKDTDLNFSLSVLQAFEQEPLTEEEVAAALKTNHLDGACCARCEEELCNNTSYDAVALKEFIQHAITFQKPMKAMLFHRGLVSVRRFVPEVWVPDGRLWRGVVGNGTNLFLRPSGFGSIKFSRFSPVDSSSCWVASLRKKDGDLLATLIIED